MSSLFTAADTNANAGTAIASTVDFGGKTYNFAGNGGGVSYTDTVASDALLANV
jgi:flagellin